MNGKQLIEEQEVFSQVADDDKYVLLDQKSNRICTTANFLYLMNTWASGSPNPLPVCKFSLFYDYLG